MDNRFDFGDTEVPPAVYLAMRPDAATTTKLQKCHSVLLFPHVKRTAPHDKDEERPLALMRLDELQTVLWLWVKDDGEGAVCGITAGPHERIHILPKGEATVFVDGTGEEIVSPAGLALQVLCAHMTGVTTP